MNDLPEPLTPADCDLREFPFMPLDVGRLRDSKLVSHVPPAQCFFAVILWCASWHQIPAASLPDDDVELARLAGFGFVVKEWKKVRAGALYGWVKCADGRLYHPVVAEKARTAWQAKHEQRWKSECARIKKHNQRHSTTVPYPTLDEFLSPDYADPTKGDKRTMSPGTNESCPDFVPGTFNPTEGIQKGQGEGEKTLKPSAPAQSFVDPAQEPGQPPSAAVEVSMSLIAWERARGKAPRGIFAGDAKVQELAAMAPTPVELRQAYDLAVADRDATGDATPVNAGFVLAMLGKVRNPPKPRGPKPIPLHAMDDNQLNAEGKRCGAGEARIGESRHEYIARIQTAQALAQGRVAA